LIVQEIHQLVDPQINSINQAVQAVQSLAQFNQRGVQTVEQISQRMANSVNDLLDIKDRDIVFQGNQINSLNRLFTDLINRLKNAGINI